MNPKKYTERRKNFSIRIEDFLLLRCGRERGNSEATRDLADKGKCRNAIVGGRNYKERKKFSSHTPSIQKEGKRDL